MNVIEREFDALAGSYEDNRLAPWYQAHESLILKHCAAPESSSTVDVLDVGCATGHLLRRFSTARDAARGVGIDISPNMINVARERATESGNENLTFFVADFETFDLGNLVDYEFDIVFCANAFHYFADPQLAADKLYEALGSTGTLLVLERDSTRSPLTLFWGYLHDKFIKDQVRFYNRAELLGYFRNAGFRNVEVCESVKRYFWKGKLFTSITLIKCQKNSNERHG